MSMPSTNLELSLDVPHQGPEVDLPLGPLLHGLLALEEEQIFNELTLEDAIGSSFLSFSNWDLVGFPKL